MNSEDLFINRFRITGKIVFLMEGGQVADLSKGLVFFLSLNLDFYSPELISEIKDMKDRLDALFMIYHQDYLDYPTGQSKIIANKYRQNLITM